MDTYDFEFCVKNGNNKLSYNITADSLSKLIDDINSEYSRETILGMFRELMVPARVQVNHNGKPVYISLFSSSSYIGKLVADIVMVIEYNQ